MVKTTVYLPDELKQALKRLAEQRQCSEADLLREAVARLTGEAEVPGANDCRSSDRPGPRLPRTSTARSRASAAMIVLDTGGLYAALDATETLHGRAVAALVASTPPRLLSPFVLAEARLPDRNARRAPGAAVARRRGDARCVSARAVHGRGPRSRQADHGALRRPPHRTRRRVGRRDSEPSPYARSPVHRPASLPCAAWSRRQAVPIATADGDSHGQREASDPSHSSRCGDCVRLDGGGRRADPPSLDGLLWSRMFGEDTEFAPRYADERFKRVHGR